MAKGEKTALRVAALLDRFDACKVECDGFTRIANSELIRAGVKHHVYVGAVTFDGRTFPLHYWIELPGGFVVDYRLRMWFGPDAPHGVFQPDPDRLVYNGLRVALSTPLFLVDVLKSL